MHRIRLLLCLSAAWLLAPSSAAAQDMANPGYIPHPEWFKQSFLDLPEDIDEAAAEGRHLMAYFYQDGCPYCKMFIENDLGQYDIAEYAKQHFDVIEINIFGALEVTDVDGEALPENEFASKTRVMFTPTVLVYGEEGGIVFRMNGYYPPAKFRAVMRFIAEKRYLDERFVEYYKEHAAPSGSGKLHDGDATIDGPPFDLSGHERPLLVLLEQKACLSCDELHQDILQRPETQALLELFEVAVLDMRSMEALVAPDGKHMPIAVWASGIGAKVAPTQVFFDAKGEEAFRNEGYIKAFHVQSMLEYVASGDYRETEDFQRYLQVRADRLREQGVDVQLME